MEAPSELNLVVSPFPSPYWDHAERLYRNLPDEPQPDPASQLYSFVLRFAGLAAMLALALKLD